MWGGGGSSISQDPSFPLAQLGKRRPRYGERPPKVRARICPLMAQSGNRVSPAVRKPKGGGGLQHPLVVPSPHQATAEARCSILGVGVGTAAHPQAPPPTRLL